MIQITIFDQLGSALADIQASVTRSWEINKTGKAEFELAIIDPKCKEEFLRFGNLIHVESDELPAWTGVIDTPRWNSYLHSVHMRPYLEIQEGIS
jgi:hypothetical protein